MKNISSIILIGFIIISFAGCKDDIKNTDSFNRSEMLRVYANDLIIPAYSASETAISALKTSADTFAQSKTLANLENVQAKWISAYASFQNANAYNFGPAAEDGLKKTLQEEVGTFPVSDSKMQSILNGGAYNVNDFNRDSRGFLAIEYLLFSQQLSNNEILVSFDSERKKEFLFALIQDVLSRVSAVKQTWNNSYKTSFIGNNGTDAGSSTSLLYNEFVKSYENLKNFELGLPLGLRPGQTDVAPNLVEARYSGQSVYFLKLQLASLENIWRGGNQEKGFKSYLNAVTGGPALVSTTEAQLGMIRQKLNAISDQTSMQQQLLNNPQVLLDLHTEIQKNTKNFKSDLSSLIGIAITFSSGDGD